MRSRVPSGAALFSRGVSVDDGFRVAVCHRSGSPVHVGETVLDGFRGSRSWGDDAVHFPGDGISLCN
jgi:hypothetical protein